MCMSNCKIENLEIISGFWCPQSLANSASAQHIYIDMHPAGWECEHQNGQQHQPPLPQLRGHVRECCLHGQDGAAPTSPSRVKSVQGAC